MLRLMPALSTRRAFVGVLALLALSVCGSGAHASRIQDFSVFDDPTAGSAPQVQFFDAQRNLYGYAPAGGDTTVCPKGCGSVFKIAPSGKVTVLHTFTAGDDGAEPTGIVMDGAGNIFGTTMDGGHKGAGTVFELLPDGTEKILYVFHLQQHHLLAPNGIWPSSGLIIGNDGNLYGTTPYGGIKVKGCGEGGCGTVFKITPAGQLTTIYAFRGPGDGCQSASGLTTDGAGNLYGTTVGCGGGNSGTVYKIDPSGTETVLHIFTEGADGNAPNAAPILDSAGNLYGDTEMGGLNCNGDVGCGIIYKVGADGSYSILYSFKSFDDGFEPLGSLYRDDAGDLYGTTFAGGAADTCLPPIGCGTVFRLAPDGTKTTLHKFLGPDKGDGEALYSGVIPGPDPARGMLYGSTEVGPDCCGMAFKISR